jgi:hypothetical protein
MKPIGYIRVTFMFREHKDRWTGKCLELGTATFGDSLEDVKEKLEEAVLCHVNTLEDVGERERFFRKHKIRFYSHRPKIRGKRLNVPYDPKVFIQPRIQPLRVAATA